MATAEFVKSDYSNSFAPNMPSNIYIATAINYWCEGKGDAQIITH
jgi:hypothetical protein